MATGKNWDLIEALFDELVALPPADRAKRLARVDVPQDIRIEVRSLLDAADGGGILDMAPPVASAMTDAQYSSLAAGDRIGTFTIERLIGRGGMGEVYLARRTTADFEQRVALKLLRGDVAGRGDLFERERRLLARLSHRGIARLIDGGIAPDGRPFMAMDHVDGTPIDAWCRANEADLAKRLALFREICDAVGYAHANLVVHRDLKPSNILIDRDGCVRLLDFGIAKLLDDSDAVPATTQAMLTPDYAAPEQLDGDAATVATDIYALGAILFELVVGAGPWRREGASIPSIIRRVLHEDPPLASKAAQRPDAPIPSARIAGDLDAIILKAMRRDPRERYLSAAELADDVQRHRTWCPSEPAPAPPDIVSAASSAAIAGWWRRERRRCRPLPACPVRATGSPDRSRGSSVSAGGRPFHCGARIGRRSGCFRARPRCSSASAHCVAPAAE